MPGDATKALGMSPWVSKQWRMGAPPQIQAQTRMVHQDFPKPWAARWVHPRGFHPLSRWQVEHSPAPG